MEWTQQLGAVTQDAENRRFLVRSKLHLPPVPVEGKADIVGQPQLAGALQTASEHGDGARGQDDTGDQHGAEYMPSLPVGKRMRARGSVLVLADRGTPEGSSGLGAGRFRARPCRVGLSLVGIREPGGHLVELTRDGYGHGSPLTSAP